MKIQQMKQPCQPKELKDYTLIMKQRNIESHVYIFRLRSQIISNMMPIWNKMSNGTLGDHSQCT